MTDRGRSVGGMADPLLTDPYRVDRSAKHTTAKRSPRKQMRLRLIESGPPIEFAQPLNQARCILPIRATVVRSRRTTDPLFQFLGAM